MEQNKRINLLLLFGGQSSEHEVSRASVSSLLPFVNRDTFNCMLAGITKSGAWYYTEASPEQIADGSWETLPGNLEAFLSPNRSLPGLQVRCGEGFKALPVDCIFPVMHGELCEDGAMQGLLELCGIPYVGSDICASASAMDKSVTKLIVDRLGIRQAAYELVYAHELCDADERFYAGIENTVPGGYPFFVKPASAGSSVGVTKAHDREELKESLRIAAEVCTKILVEETIRGHEVEVAVLGNGNPEASVVGEVLAANEFYDYEAKYVNSASRTVIPAEIPEPISAALRSAAVRIYRAIGCSGLSRVDFFATDEGEVVFNEINTLPGFTKISMYPKLWEATGIPYGALLERLVELAMEKGVRVPRA